MPIKNYHLVVGKPIDWSLDDDSSPHIELLLDGAGEKFRAAINVRSKVPPHTLRFKRIQPFTHDLATNLAALADGAYDLKGAHAHLALDYVRNGILQRDEMEELPYSFTAVFLAFGTQSWITDEQGNPIGDPVIPTEPVPSLPGTTIDSPIRIIAALVNPHNPEAGKESVTLLNTSDQNIRLDGWQLQDGNDRAELLDGLDIGAGDALRVRLSGHSMILKNKSGGRIKLISPDNILLQEVIYQKKDVRQEGWSLVI